MIKILFIDEEKNAHDDFLYYVHNHHSYSKEIIPEEMFPNAELGQMLEDILDCHPDVVITDFKLNEHKESIQYNVPYNGVDLVKSLSSRRKDFPCFIITSFDDEAIPQSDDVNIVYVKNLLSQENTENAKVTFLDKVIEQVRHYRSKIERAEKELFELIAKRDKKVASATDEARLIELDSFLENSINRRYAVPPEFKSLSNVERLSNLIEKIDELQLKLKG